MDPNCASRRTYRGLICRWAPWLVWGALFWWGALGGDQAHHVCAASFSTANFVVHTADARLAKLFAEAAENHRHQLAVAWLGHPLPDWASPCIVTAHVGPHLGAGGATTFVFDRGEVFGWRMTVQGSAERIVDSVLPHEITHMILASYFRRPIPRWADEGAATSVEHPAEQAKYYRMLAQFLRSGQTMPLERLFSLREYPPNMLVLYAQGYALTDYFIQQKGRREFVAFLKTAMESDDWEKAISLHYGYRKVSELQRSWLAWVTQGAPRARQPAEEPFQSNGPVLLAAGKKPRPEPNLVIHLRPEQAPPPLEAIEVIPAGPLVRVDCAEPLPQQMATGQAGAIAETELSGTGSTLAENRSLEGQGGLTTLSEPDFERSEVSSVAGGTGFAGPHSVPGDRSGQPSPVTVVPFAPGSIRPPTGDGLKAVQVASPFAIQTPRQQAIR